MKKTLMMLTALIAYSSSMAQIFTPLPVVGKNFSLNSGGVVLVKALSGRQENYLVAVDSKSIPSFASGELFTGTMLVQSASGECQNVEQKLVRMETFKDGQISLQFPILSQDLLPATCGATDSLSILSQLK